MSKIKEYKTGKGKKRFKFAVYAGKDETTGNSIQVRKTGFKTYEEAEKAYNLVVKKLENGTLTNEKNKRLKFIDLYKLWFPIYEQDVKESTAISTKGYFNNYILKDLGNIYLDRLTPLICQKIVNKWSNKHSYYTANSLYNYASKCLNYAVNLDLIDFNPIKRITKPRRKQRKQKKLRFYTVAELKQFLKEARKESFQKFVLFRLLSFSGMRIGELLALSWADIDFQNNTIKISKTISPSKRGLIISTPKTMAGYRTISIDEQTMNYLVKWRKEQRYDLILLNLNPFDNNQLIFPNYKYGIENGSTVRYWSKQIADNAGLKYIGAHGFRHTHASILFESGASMKEIQIRLGHASIKMTMDIYTHLTSEQETETALKFAEIMGM